MNRKCKKKKNNIHEKLRVRSIIYKYDISSLSIYPYMGTTTTHMRKAFKDSDDLHIESQIL